MTARYRPNMRIAALLALATAALVVVAAAAASDPNEPRQRHTAADTAKARSIALVLSDFAPGWTKAPTPKKTPPCSTEPDESKLVQTARLDPTYLWRDHITEVGSEVDTFLTAAQARRDWKLSTLAVMRRCLFEAIRRDLTNVTIRLQAAQQLPAPKLGERSLHYRLVFELRDKKQKTKVLPVIVELIGVGVGRTSVVLHALSPGIPVPARDLDALSSRLARRLVAASGGI
jgi:hypothetical protein